MATIISALQRSDLLGTTFVQWPGNSAAARAKRAAAAYLLSCPSLGAASSPVATAVKHELGASTQQVGLPPFRQLLQQDGCFSVQHALESEAWIELLPDRLLQATTNIPISSTSSEHGSPSTTSNTSAEQHSGASRATTLLVWPGNSAAARAKRAAAAYLLSCPSLGAASSPVAGAVKHELGATTQKMGLGPFRQLLQQDACFSVLNPLESEAWIELLPDRLLQAADASTSIAPAKETPTANIQGSSIRAAVAAVYSSSGPVPSVLRAAALFLADQAPAYRANCARVAAAVDAAVGSPAKLGLALKFRQIITADPNACFALTTSPYKSEQYVQLDVQKLLSLLHRMCQTAKQTPSWGFTAAAAPAGASSSSGSSWAAVASSSCRSSSASSSHAAAITSGSSSTINSGGNIHVLQDCLEPGVALLPMAPPPPLPPAPAAAATLHAAVLHAFKAAALAMMPPASPSVNRFHDDVDVIFVPDDDEQMLSTLQPAAAAAAVGELAVAQDKLACSREVQLDAEQWPVLQQQVLAQWWT